MRQLRLAFGATLAMAFALALLLSRSAAAGDKLAKPLSAKDLGKEWRYPGTGNDADSKGDKFVWEYSGPLGAKLKNLDRTTLQIGQPKAPFEDVWNFYAGKCGYEKKWKKDHFHAVIERTKNGGQRMVVDQTPGQRIDSGGREETHFGLFADKSIVHVEIRKVDADHTAIRILTTIP